MNSEARKLRSNSFKPSTASGRNSAISGKSKGGSFQTSISKTPTANSDIEQLSGQLFKNLQEAFDPQSGNGVSDYDLLNNTPSYNDYEDLSKQSSTAYSRGATESFSTISENMDSETPEMIRYKSVSEFAKNRVKRFKEENPSAYNAASMQFKYNRNSGQDAGPFGLTTLDYEGEIYQKESEDFGGYDNYQAEEEDPDDFFRSEVANYHKKGSNDDLEELRKMIKSTKSMINRYENQTLSLKKSVRDLNDCAGSMGVKGDVMHRIDSTLEELRDLKTHSMKGAPNGFVRAPIKSSLINKASDSTGKSKPITSSNYTKPSSAGGLSKLTIRKKFT